MPSIFKLESPVTHERKLIRGNKSLKTYKNNFGFSQMFQFVFGADESPATHKNYDLINL